MSTMMYVCLCMIKDTSCFKMLLDFLSICSVIMFSDLTHHCCVTYDVVLAVQLRMSRLNCSKARDTAGDLCSPKIVWLETLTGARLLL